MSSEKGKDADNTKAESCCDGKGKEASDQQQQQEETDKQRKLKVLEAKAVAEATATADAAFLPSASLLNATTPGPLLKSVDGPSLRDYDGKESIYVGRSVPVSAGGSLVVPIQVATPGSVVEYAVENKHYDIGFGITAEREEGITIVKNVERVDATQSSITGKFLVGSVPCLLQFRFENEYSWMREKVVSYKVTVTPPSRETLQAGRRRRAQACLKAVVEDRSSAQTRLQRAQAQTNSLEQTLKRLEKELEQTKQSLQVTTKEEQWLQDRVKLRSEQENMLHERLELGWEDEPGKKKANDSQKS